VFPVDLPSSRFDAHPVSAIPLPTTQESVLLYLNAPQDRLRAKKLAVRVSTAQADPLVGGIDASITDIQFIDDPPLDSLYPSSPPNTETAQFATLASVSSPYSVDNESWKFASVVHASGAQRSPSPYDDVAYLIVFDSSLSDALKGRPFIRFQLSAYQDDDKYPCLQHTAASDILETSWVQLYPHGLGDIRADRENAVVQINNAWAMLPNTKDDASRKMVLRYRFSAFATSNGDTTPGLHVATIITDSHRVDWDLIRLPARAKLKELTGLDNVPNVWLHVYGEEGFLADTYVPDRDQTTGDSPDRKLFVRLRTAAGRAELLL
jgi:hypothetical protein